MKFFPNLALAWMCLCFLEYIYLLKEEYDPIKHKTISSIVCHNPRFILTVNVMTPFTIVYETMDTDNDWNRIASMFSLLMGLHGVVRTTEHTVMHNLFAMQCFSGIISFMEHMKGYSKIKKLMLLLNLSIVAKIIIKKLINIEDIFTEECMFVSLFAVSYLME